MIEAFSKGHCAKSGPKFIWEMDELALSVAKRMSNNEWGIAVYSHPSQFIRSISGQAREPRILNSFMLDEDLEFFSQAFRMDQVFEQQARP